MTKMTVCGGGLPIAYQYNVLLNSKLPMYFVKKIDTMTICHNRKENTILIHLRKM